MKKNSTSVWIALTMLIFTSLSPICSASLQHEQATVYSSNAIYLGYASIIGEGNSSVLEAHTDNEIRIKIESESELLDFYIDFDMACNGVTDEGIIVLTLSFDGENVSTNITQTPTTKMGSLFLHDVAVSRGETFVFVINVIYGNLIPLYHNETRATGAAIISKHSASTVDNTPPNPPVIVGPTLGKVNDVYTFEVTVSDPDDNEGLIELEIYFGDDLLTTDSGCCGQVWENGQVVYVNYKWVTSGKYNITGRVMDAQFAWSNWSEPIPIRISKVRGHILELMNSFLQRHGYDSFERGISDLVQ